MSDERRPMHSDCTRACRCGAETLAAAYARGAAETAEAIAAWLDRMWPEYGMRGLAADVRAGAWRPKEGT